VRRGDVLIAGVIALVTAASWSASLAYDAGQREAGSYAEGQRWAQRAEPTADECRRERLRVSGPEIIGGAWLDGCLTAVAPGPPGG
jgi:hypothetical protein